MSPGGTSSTSSDSPNVILISLDTLRWDALFKESVPGDPITEFRENATQLQQVISHSSWTLPSHASLFTGLLPYKHRALLRGAANAPMDTSLTTAPEQFQQLGYATGGFTDGGYLSRSWGFSEGFDRYRITGESRHHLAKHTVTKAKQWIRNRTSSSPLFAFIHTYQIHDYWKIHSHCRSSMSSTHRRRIKRNTSVSLPIDNLNELARSSPSRLEIGKVLYDCEVKHTFNRIGSFMEWLRERGLYDSSLVIIFSDHGEGFSLNPEVIGHGGGQLAERLTRVPVMVKYPEDERYFDRSELIPVRRLFPRLLEPYFQFPLNNDSSFSHLMDAGVKVFGSGYLNSNTGDTEQRDVKPVFFTRTSRYRMDYNPVESTRSYYRTFPETLEQMPVSSQTVPHSVKRNLTEGFMDYVDQSTAIYRTLYQREQSIKREKRRKSNQRREALDGLGYLD